MELGLLTVSYNRGHNGFTPIPKTGANIQDIPLNRVSLAAILPGPSDANCSSKLAATARFYNQINNSIN